MIGSLKKAEIIIYQPNDQSTMLEVRIEEETVWLTQAQMGELFQATKQNISLHINNIFREGELIRDSVVKEYLTTASDGKKYKTKFYNLDVIISIGYRVKSQRGTQFRIWANKIIKEYLLKGYAISYRVDKIERKLIEHDQKFDLLIKTNLPPTEGIFYNGQIFDAYKFVADIIKSANITKQLKLDIKQFNTQYPRIEIKTFKQSHDRFLIIDNETVYHIGASLKDLGKKWFAFSRINIDAGEMIDKLE